MATLTLEHRLVDTDESSVKLLWREESGRMVESAAFNAGYGYGVCVSSQFGCAIGCSFCATSRQGVAGNLAAEQMFLQAMGSAVAFEQEFGRRGLRFVTLAGMGEPLANYRNSVQAMRLLLEAGVPGVSVSTSGVVEPLRELIKESMPFRVYLSLHACTEELRARLIPASRRTKIDVLIDILTRLAEDHEHEPAHISYLLLRGVNDSDLDLSRLIELVKGRPLVVQLLMWNPVEGAPFQRAPDGTANRWRSVLFDAGVPAYVMPSRGRKIQAACGQLTTLKAEAGFQIKGRSILPSV